MRRFLPIAGLAIAFASALATSAQALPDSFRFAILGDRTGEVQPGVFEQALKEIAAAKPAFVLGVGDMIQGGSDSSAEAEWRQVDKLLAPYRSIAFYLAPGNHDIWSAQSESLFRKHTARPTHYGFDYRQLHVTVLDNSRSDDLSAAELAFLENDLRASAAQPLKLIVFHQPSWLFYAALGNTNFPLHQLAKKYGVQAVISGHVHQMLHAGLDDVTYIAVPSSGGHLRGAKRYDDGAFFGYVRVDVRGKQAQFQIKELNAPNGQGRVTAPKDWGIAGLAAR